MTGLKLTAAALLALSVAGCSSMGQVTRNAPLDAPALAAGQQEIARNYDPQYIIFAASADLQVSEGNGYYPMADIVWRGDPIGDRSQQIGEMFRTAVGRVSERLDGPVPVVVSVELVRFHGVTERTRYTIGGNYNIVFNMTVLHGETGAVIEPARRVVGNLSAPGGIAAVMADQRGQTEKVRVTDFLTQMLTDELTGSFAGIPA